MPYHISTDPALLQRQVIYDFLRRTYWSPNIRREVIDVAIANSRVVGAYVHAGDQPAPGDLQQVGFARAVTDGATFAWVADVFVLEPHRGHDLARRMVRTLMADPTLRTLRRWCLATRDAERVYAPLGFTRIPPERIWMEHRPDPAAWQDTP
jgi:GNAT superfamily N-acetyltransferase